MTTMPMNAPDPLSVPEEGGAPPGYRLGNFELQAAVALHANGVVYRGWDHNLGIPVAIKEYLPLRLARRKPDGDIEPLDADTIDAFERGRHAFVDEARLLARCDHPSLLRVRQLLQAHGTAYRVMPWYVGRPLLDVRREMQDPPDETALRALLDQLLGALEAYHRVGGVHGNVNPAQIMLLDDDRALLLGPGAARRATAVDAVETLMRQLEPSFVAPEQLAPSDHSPAGPWTDFYALARVARFCISGMLPAPPGGAAAEPLKATIDKLYFDAPGVDYSEQFLATLDAAAAPQIDRRPQTVAEFCQWLDHGPPRAAVSAAAAPLADTTAAPPAVLPGTEAATPAIAVPPADAPRFASASAAPSPPAVPPHDEEAVDAETVDLIQRVIESIPARDERPQHVAAPEPAWQADRDLDMPFTALPRHRPVPVFWVVLVVALLAFIGYAAWELQRGEPRNNMESALAATGSPKPSTAASATPSTVPVPAPAALVEAPAPTSATAATAAAERPVEAVPPPVANSATAAGARADPGAPAAVPATPGDDEPAARTATARSGPDSPRQACGERTQFSLYRCMQQQCATAAWARHPQCVRLKATDTVD